MWNLHTTQPKYFALTYSEVVNLTGLAKNKGLNIYCEKRCLLAVNEKGTMFAVKETGVCSRLYYQCKRMDQGPQFTRGVSP
jgi:hypothetical protein